MYANAIDNKQYIKKEWMKLKQRVLNEINNICNMDIDYGNEPIKIYIMPITMQCGVTFANKREIYWSGAGRNEFDNYDVIYIMHEIFHLIFPPTPLHHAIQELICDNELRIRLNNNANYRIEINGTIYESIGHDALRDLRTALLLYWKSFLSAKTENIFEFINRIMHIDEIQNICKNIQYE